jgi:hypothetical protein
MAGKLWAIYEGVYERLFYGNKNGNFKYLIYLYLV